MKKKLLLRSITGFPLGLAMVRNREFMVLFPLSARNTVILGEDFTWELTEFSRLL